MSLCPGKFAAQHFGQLTQWNDRLWWLSSWLSKNCARIGLVENFTLIPRQSDHHRVRVVQLGSVSSLAQKVCRSAVK